MRLSERIYRRLLALYPRDFRDEYGQEMSLLFRARAREGGVRLWCQVLGDLLCHAPRSIGASQARTCAMRCVPGGARRPFPQLPCRR